jgi:hypothetical protein
MYLLIFLYFSLYNGFFYGDIIHHEDRVFKNNSFTYYYDNQKLQHLKNKYIDPVEKENKKCKLNSDCQTDWCNSGSKCSKEGFCLNLLGFPCPHTMKCNYKKRICEPIQCFTRYQCSDAIFCNGYELCEDRICKRSKQPCLYGTCFESNKSCLFTDTMRKIVNDNSLSIMEVNDNPENKLIYSNYISVNLTKADELIHILLTGDPLWDSNSLDFQVAFLVIVIVLFILIIGLCLIVAFKPCCSKRIK